MADEPDVYEMGELYPAFESNVVDDLLRQLKDNRASARIELALLDDGKVELLFYAQDQKIRAVRAATVAQALYDACCINEGLHQCTGSDCPTHGEDVKFQLDNTKATAAGLEGVPAKPGDGVARMTDAEAHDPNHGG